MCHLMCTAGGLRRANLFIIYNNNNNVSIIATPDETDPFSMFFGTPNVSKRKSDYRTNLQGIKRGIVIFNSA